MRTNLSIVMAGSLALALTFGCTPDVEPPPPPPENPISSSAQARNYCVYQETRQCYQGPYSSCPAGGELSDFCPFPTPSSSSHGEAAESSSSNGNAGGLSSAQIEQGSSSGGVNPPPTSSSSNVVSPLSSSATVPSSSSSSSGGVSQPPVSSSSGSQGSGQVDGSVFTDQRDGKNYKFEVAPDGKIWMSENLNYSKNNTLGYCYGVDIDGANPHRDSTSCDSGYGRVYEYATAMDGNGPQGLCPNGWHVPSTTEWGTIVGNRKMSVSFYIFSGTTDYPLLGWRDRGRNGFYWTSNGNGYFTGLWHGSGSDIYEVETQTKPSDDTDYFSVRCIANDDFKISCGTGSYIPATQFCSGGEVYAKCGGKEYNPAEYECVDGVLNRIGAKYQITCIGAQEVESDCGKKTVTLKVNDCVDINVLGYTNEHFLPNVGMRCQATSGQSISVTISLNGTPKTYTGSSYSWYDEINIGRIKVGDNEFGTLCVTALSGASSVECRGPINK